jgi:hypothetical protein
MKIVNVLALALLIVLAVLVACSGGGSTPAVHVPPEPIEGGLPPNFPDDFPLYPDLKIESSTPLAGRYVVEASTSDPVDDVVQFYKEELAKGRWKITGTEDSAEPQSTLFHFTADGFSSDVDGRLLVSEDTSVSGRTIVAIAMPFEALQGD